MSKFLFVALVLSAISCAAEEKIRQKSVPVESSIYELSKSDPIDWVRPQIFVPPDYPVRAVQGRISGYVDVDVLVTENGRVGEIRSLTSTPKNDEFEDSVRAVVKQWRFHAAWSNCRPFESVGNVRVWFEMKGEAGVVSVSNRIPPREQLAEPGKVRANALTNPGDVRAAVKYPKRARKTGAEGYVCIRLMVDAKTASLTSVDVLHARSNPAGYEEDFIEASKMAIAVAKLQPIPDREKPIEIHLPFDFRLK